MAEETKVTFCRICEAFCGLKATVQDGRITAIAPDKEHPLTKGYACIKGLHAHHMHDDPARINHPMKRVGQEWQRISWEQAFSEIGGKIRQLQKDHGERSVAVYLGNPIAFNYTHQLFAGDFAKAIKTPNVFTSSSIDCNNKFEVAKLMYGSSVYHPVPDLTHTRFLLCLGSNPAVSQMSFIHAPNALALLRGITHRGGRVVTVDPRRTETAEGVGEHLFIRPGTDAYLLAALLNEMIAGNLVKTDILRQHTKGWDKLAAAVKPWTARRAAEITGIPAETIQQLARDFAAADGASVYMSVGVNMGPFGSLGYLLVQALNLASGNLDRKGGAMVATGPFNIAAMARRSKFGTSARRSRIGNHKPVADGFPAAILADEIEQEGEGRIRAMIVSAGNPAHSVPGGRIAKALEKLELLVSIDIYPNETSRHAHYRLPTTDMFERDDYPLAHAALQETPFAQFTDPIVPPMHERREEWRIFSGLAEACGVALSSRTLLNWFPAASRWTGRLSLGLFQLHPKHLLDAMLRMGGQVSLAKLRRNPHGLLLKPHEGGSFLGKRVMTQDGKVNLAPESVVGDFARMELQAARLGDASVMRVIGRRERKSHNSWMHNNPGIKQPGGNAALIHPADAAARGIAEGDDVEVSGNGRSIRLPAKVTDAVMAGVVAVPHGWGHDASGVAHARGLGGANLNEVMPGGADHIEPVSGQAIMTGHPVELRRAAMAEERVA